MRKTGKRWKKNFLYPPFLFGAAVVVFFDAAVFFFAAALASPPLLLLLFPTSSTRSLSRSRSSSANEGVTSRKSCSSISR